MSCSRGKASPNSHTKLRLFADSAGYCQNPACNTNLFLSIGEEEFHIAEMAHIFSAGDGGPRSKIKLSKEERGKYENLILLCPNCHTEIDKVESKYSDERIRKWKKEHNSRIINLFNLSKFSSRSEARDRLEPLLRQNRAVFTRYGPMTERFNPESESPRLWLIKIHEFLLPNNRKIVQLLEDNYEYLNDSEMEVFEFFKQHVHDFELKHLDNKDINGIQFPDQMNKILT